MRKNVLLVIETNTYYKELFRVAELLLQTPDFRPLCFFPGSYDTQHQHVAACKAAGILSLVENKQNFSPGEYVQNAKGLYRDGVLARLFDLLLHDIEKLLRALHSTFLSDFFSLYRRLTQRHQFAKQLMKTQKISLIIVGGDLVHYDTSTYIHAGHALNIPSIIVPCTMSNALEMAENYFDDPRYSLRGFWNRLVGHLFPSWVYEHRGKKLLRLPAGKALAKICLHVSPPLPWINNSTYADVIAAESEAMVHYYTREGIPFNKIVVTGSPTHDVLGHTISRATEKKNSLMRRLGLTADSPLILSALPPDIHHRPKNSQKGDFSTYESLIRYWAKKLGEIPHHHTIINLHPSVNPNAYRFLEQYNITIIEGDVAEYIPLCKFFVASVSSVIRWAIMCGKPVLNYDVYRLRYNDYDAAPGVVTTEEKDTFETLLRRFSMDQSYFLHITSLQQRDAPQWGNLDAKNWARLLTLFRNVLEENDPSSHQNSKRTR